MSSPYVQMIGPTGSIFNGHGRPEGRPPYDTDKQRFARPA